MVRASVAPKAPELPVLKPLVFEDYTLDINYYLRADYHDTLAAQKELPIIVEYVNQMYQEAFRAKLQWEDHESQAVAQAYKRLKDPDEWASAGLQGRITEEAVKHAINLDSTVIEYRANIAHFVALTSRLRGTMENLKIKLDLLRSSEATRRLQFEHERRED